MYHILYDLETQYESLQQVQEMLKDLVLMPRIPKTHMPEEDSKTPRICVAPTIEDCITAIGIFGAFRRCANTNADAKSYENDNEVYPIVILKFADDEDYIRPSKEQVPDVGDTNEHWLLNPTKPIKCKLRWLNHRSIKFKYEDTVTKCTKLTCTKSIKGKDHPWLNEKGHPLDCPDYGYEVYPNHQPIFHPQAQQFLCWDASSAKKFVFPVPISNSYALCHTVQITDTGFVLTGEVYRNAIHRLRRFSGFYDKNGDMLFDTDCVWYGDTQPKKFGHIMFYENEWILSITALKDPIKLKDIANEQNILELVNLAGADHINNP